MAGLLGLVLLGCGGRGGDAETSAPIDAGKTRADAAAGVPAIDLERRLAQAAADAPLGTRNLFDYGPPPTTLPPPPPPTLAPVATLPPPVTEPTPTPPPPLPPLSVKYVGSVEQRGIRVAMFLNDKKEMLTGQAGEIVANRFRVVKIGLESVDIQEVGSEQVRRIPLRGN